MEYRVITDTEAQANGLGKVNYILAIDNNRIVCLSSLFFGRRTELCDNCTGSCAQGNMVWTHPDYRNQGLLKTTFNWGKEQLGVDKVYIGDLTLSAESRPIFWKEQIFEHDSVNYVSEPPTYAQGEQFVLEARRVISEAFGYDE